MNFKKHYLTILLPGMMFLSAQLFAQTTVTGTIRDQSTQKPLAGANISLDRPGLYCVSDSAGNFRIPHLKRGKYTLKATYIGFTPFVYDFVLHKDTAIQIGMIPSPILGEEVNITATRAQGQYPTTFTRMDKEQINEVNLGKDMPYILQSTPSVITTSDAGTGIGYTGMNIRGTDLTRINVTINGIPVNDAESQGVWFVDLPDLASSTQDIQVQRGVGTSTNGAGAFGASINIMTSTVQEKPFAELDLSGGSFGTYKTTLRFGSGLIFEKIAIDGRVSYISSDGYIDRAFSKLKSYSISAGYYGKNTTLKFLTFSGIEKTYQAWEGVPKDSLATNRTYNPSGEYIDKYGQLRYYDNQTDNYQQDNYQLIFSQSISDKLNFNFALHYTKGKGYYESYDPGASFASYGLQNVIIGPDTIFTTDLVNRKMMDNDFWGLTFSGNYKPLSTLQFILGGAWNQYYGKQFGKVIWAEYASNGDNERNWYYNTGNKKDFTIYLKGTWEILKKISLFADLQYRYIWYKMDGTLDDLRNIDQLHDFNFFNPKAGVKWNIAKEHDLYFSFGVANREPSRNNYKDASPDRIPDCEKLYDYELGYDYKSQKVAVNANLYYMNYLDQLVLTGEINNVGEAVMVNVPHSYRAGIELSFGWKIIRILDWNLNATFSRNKIRDFTQYVDTYDSVWNFTGQTSAYLGNTDLSFSPNIILNNIISVKPVKGLQVQLVSKYVSRQYIDNTSSTSRSLDPYFIHGLGIGYSFKTRIFREIGFNLAINNLFSSKYETNAWVYQATVGGQPYEVNGYFPQALINFLIGVSIKL